jgi:DNA repair exonuclease SbcCD ATPase subunit
MAGGPGDCEGSVCEVFDGLDDIGINAALEIIKERQERISSIYVLSHRQSLKSQILSHLRVEKTNDISTLLMTTS